MSVDIEPPVEATELMSKRVCVCAVAEVNCAEILGELDVLIPPPEAELATAVAVGLETPPEATELPVDCMDVPDVVPLILLVAVRTVLATTFSCISLLSPLSSSLATTSNSSSSILSSILLSLLQA